MKKNLASDKIRRIDNAAQGELSGKEYELYSLYFQQEYPDQLVIIGDLTQKADLSYPIKWTDVKVDVSLIDDFNEKNKSQYKVENKFDVSQKIILLSSAKLEQIMHGKTGWGGFREEYPTASGVLFLSRAGFNNDKTQAILEVDSRIGDLTGSGTQALYVKENGAWVFKEDYLTWIS